MSSAIADREGKVVVVTGTIGGDAHVIGNWLLRHTLEDAGVKVVGLGACVNQETFVEAALETRADAILISSVYGMGLLDCRGLRDMCREAGIGDILIYVGGNVYVGQSSWEESEAEFKSIGIDRVYPPGTPPALCIPHLAEDLGLTEAS
jgi:methylaspartate mutase sigma subunit